MKITKGLIIAVLCIAIMCIPVSAMTGTGTQSDPYIIYNQQDLALLSGNGYASYIGTDKYFELRPDSPDGILHMSGTFTPIGNNMNKFNGHFDGKGHTIKNLKTSGDPTGMFQYVTSGAYIANINFENAQITGTGHAGTGVLYGRCVSASTKVQVINVNVYNSFVASSGYYVGGIAGFGAYSSSTVEFTSCNVKNCQLSSLGGDNVGGIASYGAHTSSTVKFSACNVENCICTAVSVGNVGGIAGGGAVISSAANFEACHVKNCYLFSNSPSSTNEGFTGGITGCYYDRSSGSISDCTVESCTIRSAYKYAGGILGGVRGNTVGISNCAVTDCTIIAQNSYGAGAVAVW